MDDYGYSAFPAHGTALNDATKKGVKMLSLATGQGFIVKPA